MQAQAAVQYRFLNGIAQGNCIEVLPIYIQIPVACGTPPASDRTQSCKGFAAGLCGLLRNLIALFIPKCEWCSSFMLLEACATEFAIRAQIAV
jgi:hypothetical protein